MADGKLLCVPPSDVAAVWPMVAKLIDSAFAKLDEPTPDYLPWLVEQKGLLWIYVKGEHVIAAATSSFIQARGGLACRLVACGGESGLEGAEMWRRCIAEIEAYAKSQGCYKMLIDGRRGWGKVLSGYDPKCVSFEKRLLIGGSNR